MLPQAVEKPDTLFTWANYCSWPNDERWELIAGVAYAMAPAPSTRHQSITLNLASRLRERLAGRPCRPFIAPTDVKLSDLDVVQPDILVVCDPTRVTPTHIEGAPDLVIEILSPTTAAKDLRQKKALYEQAGVREYLVIDPLEQYAIRFLLGTDGFDQGTVFAADELLVIATLEALEIPLWEIFELEGPREGRKEPRMNTN